MKLNHDCIRTLLFQLEEKTSFSSSFEYDINDDYPELNDYSAEEIQYHIQQMYMSNLCTKPLFHSDGFEVMDLTSEGHKFLAEIRSDTHWNRIKDISKQASIWTLDGFKQIATQVAVSAINQIINPLQ